MKHDQSMYGEHMELELGVYMIKRGMGADDKTRHTNAQGKASQQRKRS